jgi:hypothetical protein
MPESTRGVAASSLGILSYNSVIRSHSAAAISGWVYAHITRNRAVQKRFNLSYVRYTSEEFGCVGSVSIRGSQRQSGYRPQFEISEGMMRIVCAHPDVVPDKRYT